MAMKQGNIYPYDVMFLLSPIHGVVPEGFSFTEYVKGSEADLTGYLVLGDGVTDLSESPNAETSDSAFIINKSITTTVDGYKFEWSGEAEKILSDEALKVIHDTPYKKKTGADATLCLLVVDTYNSLSDTVFPARFIRCSCVISTITGEAAQKSTFDFTLAAANDPILGVYDKATKTFHADNDQQLPTAP